MLETQINVELFTTQLPRILRCLTEPLPFCSNCREAVCAIFSSANVERSGL